MVDEVLYSSAGNLRGLEPDSSAETKGFVDGIGILPTQQAEILEAIDINRLVDPRRAFRSFRPCGPGFRRGQ